MIKVNSVSFAYENAVKESAVNNVQACIPEGQVILLCGESGSGKTTFGRLVNGLIPAYYEGSLNGQVIVRDKDVRNVELYELTPHVGSVFQNPKSQFYTLLTDTEIVFACENMGMKKEKILERFENTIESLHIEDLVGKSLFELSGGEKQKIACASVHALMPDIFVLDEPTSNLDIGTIQGLREIIKGWKMQGKTIIVVEHRLTWLRGIADRILYFQNGRIAGDFKAENFWLKGVEELHNMGLRAASNFEPLYNPVSFAKERIEMQDFRFSLKGQELLNVEQMSIPKGAVVAVLGDNGAGKTTFARCLCGLEKKSKGKLVYAGQVYTWKQRIKLCYMVMQDVNHQLFAESVMDEVLLGAENLNNEEGKVAAESILDELDLCEYKDSHPMSLSGGQKQRVAIAGAIASHKEIIVFDEPTSGLDFRHMKEVAKNIKKLSTMGKTQFVITHDPELVASCCDYFLFIEHGQVIRSGEWTKENVRFVSEYFALVEDF